MRTRRWAALATLTVVMAACGSGGSDGGGSSGPTGRGTTSSTGASGATAEPTGARPSSPAKLTIVSPKNGAVVHGTSVDLRVNLEGAKIVPSTTTDIVPDEGHLHVILDDTLISMTEGTEQTVADLTPGLHRIQVEFVASDHAPFDPRVVAIVSFEVKP
jgi:Family of unknown function (DUF6130)